MTYRVVYSAKAKRGMAGLTPERRTAVHAAGRGPLAQHPLQPAPNSKAKAPKHSGSWNSAKPESPSRTGSTPTASKSNSSGSSAGPEHIVRTARQTPRKVPGPSRTRRPREPSTANGSPTDTVHPHNAPTRSRTKHN